MDAVHVVITSAEGVIGIIDGWTGPLPRVGDALFHPPSDDNGIKDLSVAADNVMSVKTVTWGLLMRGPEATAAGHFTRRYLPMVEIYV